MIERRHYESSSGSVLMLLLLAILVLSVGIGTGCGGSTAVTQPDPGDEQLDPGGQEPDPGTQEPDPPPAVGPCILFAPLAHTTTYLIDLAGDEVHSWQSGYTPGNAVYLQEDGRLLLTCNVGNPLFEGGGTGGRIEEYDWDGNLTWEFDLSSDRLCQHHDIETLPSGNVLVLAWERFMAPAAVAAGRDPALLSDGELWATCILEVEPLRPSGGSVVWEWHLWDHLIQDLDPQRANHGDVAAHPELVDLNFAQGGHKDWTHCNAVDFSADFDQIALSIHNFGELWIIDHSATTAEAAGHGGGDQGRGGDLLYRWGNPRAYRAGGAADQWLFGQHDVQWIAAGLSGAGNLLIYNNGLGRPGGSYSNILEITTPVGADGSYALAAASYGPSAPAWEYLAEPPESFYSHHISGVQRLESGNTLVCCGADGWLFEVTPAGQIVWEYVNPHSDPGAVGNSVFRATRYEADYPGLAGLY